MERDPLIYIMVNTILLSPYHKVPTIPICIWYIHYIQPHINSTLESYDYQKEASSQHR